jgi:two-component system sensor kinase FixL
VVGRRKDGTDVPIELSLTPIQTSEGSFVLASMSDLTARKALEREQAVQRDELFHLSRVAVLGELLASLSHELHQPLTTILTNAQAGQMVLGPSAPQPVDLVEVRAMLDDIVTAGRRAGEIIHRLRALFRKGEVRYEALDVNDVVLDVLKLLNGDLVHHGVALHTALAAGLPRVRGDRVQLQQVLINLIVNATDAMGGGAAAPAAAERGLSARTRLDDEGRVELIISDTGCGIPRGELDRIFEPFHTTKAKGTGLGLAVCRTIIAAHSGKLWATNNVDRGACFHVALPPDREGAV